MLRERGKPIRAMARRTSDAAVVEDLKRRGAEIVYADLKDRPSLDAACRNVDTVISTASSTFSRQEGDSIESVDRQGQINLIDAAKGAAVRRFTFVSINHQKIATCALSEAKDAAEKHLMKSGMEWTILRPSVFMDVWLTPMFGFDAVAGKATIYGSGRNPISWINSSDVAAFTVAVLDHPAARNRISEIGGPEALSPLEVVRIFEKTAERQFEVQHVPEEGLRAQLEAATDPLQHSFTSLMLYYANGDRVDMSETLREVPIRLRSVRDYAEGFTGGR
jgi:NADH dehydrogenase